MESKKFLDNLSTNLKDMIARAISLAASFDHAEVAPCHLLFAASEQHGSVAAEIIQKYDFDAERMFQLIGTFSIPTVEHTKQQRVTFPNLNKSSKKILEKAMLTAYEYKHNYVGTEHVLFGIIHSEDPHVEEMLRAATMVVEAIEEQLIVVLQSTAKFPDVVDIAEAVNELTDTDDSTPDHTDHQPSPLLSAAKHQHGTSKHASALDVFTTNLTEKHVQKHIDPVIGREEEVERLIHILARRHKNNPILVGEPGVGKTAIVEGLAKRILEGAVPDLLKRKKILSLDLTLLVAGTIYRGEFEGRLKQLVDEVAKNPNIILFVDEIHNIIGTGSNQGTMDAANILKPALARGQLRCIGATTIAEYKKYISSDSAFERRFQSIDVDEPSREDAVTILRGIKPYYDAFHGTDISQEAIEAAVDFSSRYIHSHHLPDKAIDLIDEAAARVRSQRKQTKSEAEIAEIEQEIDRLTIQKDTAVKSEQFDAAITLKQNIAALESRVTKLRKIKRKQSVSVSPIGRTEIAEALGRRLKIDPTIILQSDWEYLTTLPETLKKHIIGQDHVIDSIAKTLRLAYLRESAHGRPFASFLFAGPSGVGKTALAKHIATALFHNEKALLRLDMSEFSEAHGVSKLLGSPAGYVGYKDQNRFFDHLKKYPYSVVLFDEVDKAHPDVRKLLLQILDEGELKDSHGTVVSLRHAIIILTTNVGAELYKSGGIGFQKVTKKQNHSPSYHTPVLDKIKEEFSNAVLGRLDHVSLFAPISKEHLTDIVRIKAANIVKTIQASRAISIRIPKKTVIEISTEMHNPDTGARHIERHIEQLLHEQLADVLTALPNNNTKTMYRLTKKNGTYQLV